jgi:hypothetical protein
VALFISDWADETNSGEQNPVFSSPSPPCSLIMKSWAIYLHRTAVFEYWQSDMSNETVWLLKVSCWWLGELANNEHVRVDSYTCAYFSRYQTKPKYQYEELWWKKWKGLWGMWVAGIQVIRCPSFGQLYKTQLYARSPNQQPYWEYLQSLDSECASPISSEL